MAVARKAAVNQAVRIKFIRGVTLLDLLVVASIITIVGALLFPVYIARQEQARRDLCLNRIRLLGDAAVMYAADNDGWLPPYGSRAMPNSNMLSFRLATERYVESPYTWNCPGDHGQSGDVTSVGPTFASVYASSYLFNSTIYILAQPARSPKKLEACRNKEKLVLYWDRVFHPQAMFWVQNVVYGDGHVDGLNKSQLRYQVEEATKSLWGRRVHPAPVDGEDSKD